MTVKIIKNQRNLTYYKPTGAQEDTMTKYNIESWIKSQSRKRTLSKNCKEKSSLRDMQDNVKHSDICVIEMPERKESEEDT